MKTKTENKQINLKILSLNLDLSYQEVGELIDLIPRFSDLKALKNDLMKWHLKIK